MWSVVVEDKASGRELARYTYDARDEAQEARSTIQAIRIVQNHERVRVKIVRER